MRILLLLGIVYCATSLNAGIANAKSHFDGIFFKAVVEDKSGNTICSPISAELILIAAIAGADGATLRQLTSFIENTDVNAIKRINTFVMTRQYYSDIELHVACKVFIAEGFSLTRQFNDVNRRWYSSSVENINFGDAVKASKTINDWSAAHTNNRIRELVTPDKIDPDTAVVLLNAVYFKGLWANPFDAKKTQLRPFHVNGRRIVQVPTMHRSGQYLSGSLPELKASFIKIPYQTHDFDYSVSMYIILPDETNGFVELKKKFHQITIEMLRGGDVHLGEVELFLPKFKIESYLDLKDPLMKMGLTDMFSYRADFSRMVENANLEISKIIQKAFIEVNEEGSEAGAITEADEVFREQSKRSEFIVDRPFFSLIVTESKATLFSALIVDPGENIPTSTGNNIPIFDPDRIYYLI